MWAGIIIGVLVGTILGVLAGYRLGKEDAVWAVIETRAWARDAVTVTEAMLRARPCAVCGARRLDGEVA